MPRRLWLGVLRGVSFGVLRGFSVGVLRTFSIRVPRTLSARLYAIAGAALLAIELLAGAAIHYAASTSEALESLHTETLAAMVRAAEIERTVEKHRRIVEGAPSDFDRERIVAGRAALAALEQRIAELLAERPDDYARHIATAMPLFASEGLAVLDLAAQYAQDRASQAAGVYAGRAESLQGTIGDWRRASFGAGEAQIALLLGNSRRLLGWVFVTALVALVLIGPVSLMLMRSVTGRLAGIGEAMLRLARNDTSVVVPAADARDEISDMARAVAVFKSNAVALLDHRARLIELNAWLDIALNNMARGLSMFDAGDRLVLSNATYQHMYAMPHALTRHGTPIGDILAHRRTLTAAIEVAGTGPADTFADEFDRLIARRQRASVTQRMADGRIIAMEFEPLAQGGWVAVHQDVTAERQAEERIARLARHDTLTGLVNRRVFNEEIERRALRAGRTGFALISIDLDRFKEVNDTLGHPAGDALLQAVALRLAGVTRKTDLIARLGGDEFAVIAIDAGSRAEAAALAQRIIETIAEPFALAGETVAVGASVGIALVADGETLAADVLLGQADLALYEAKAAGRGVARFFEPHLRDRAVARRHLEHDLGAALANGEFRLVYQPILSLARGTITSCEALIRWHHPVRGLVSPMDFIPLAESSGLIGAIGAWALETACRAALAWPEQVRVAVNLSGAQFDQRNVAADVVAALAATGLSPRRLELEVTETVLLTNSPATLEALHRLRDLGIAIALDDFGTGYASLSYLKSFPFDKLKIDQSFVRDLPDRAVSVAIVQAVANLAHSLDMRCVAEGVETVEHLERVRAAGCDELQGYLFSRPGAEHEIVRVIADLNRSRDARATVG